MKIDTMMVGPIMTNCYLLQDEKAAVCALIDPGDDAKQVETMVDNSGCTLQYILLTHGHFDHCSAVRPLLEKYDVPVYIHRADATDRQGHDLMFQRVDEQHQRYYDEGDTLTLGELTIRVMHTPGHSKGSVCLVVNDVIFAGDTLFRASCGRTDFPGGSMTTLTESLRRLAKLPSATVVVPGHGASTSIGREVETNPFML